MKIVHFRKLKRRIRSTLSSFRGRTPPIGYSNGHCQRPMMQRDAATHWQGSAVFMASCQGRNTLSIHP